MKFIPLSLILVVGVGTAVLSLVMIGLVGYSYVLSDMDDLARLITIFGFDMFLLWLGVISIRWIVLKLKHRRKSEVSAE